MALTVKQIETSMCSLCRISYNLKERKPLCFMPCGHTCCQKCVDNFVEKFCPNCKKKFSQSIPDYDMIDTLNKIQSTSSSLQKSSGDLLRNQLRPEVIYLITDGTREQQLIGVRSLRKLLSKEINPPIQEVIEAGLVDKLVELLDSNYNSGLLQYEATWALTNITSGTSEQTSKVVNAGAISRLIKLVDSTNEECAETAIWALGNIAGDSAAYRDLVIKNGALKPIVTVLSKESIGHSLKKNGIWAICNFCRNKNRLVEFEQIECVLPVLATFINSHDHELLTDVCWAVSYLTDGSNDRIELIIKHFELKRFVALLKHNCFNVLLPALRTIGNIVTGSDIQTQAILDCNVLPRLLELANSENPKIRKEVFWTVSNITAGSIKQIQEVIDSHMFPMLVKALKSDASGLVVHEASWALANALSGASCEQIKYFCDLNILRLLFNSLKSTDAKLVQITLESLICLLEKDAIFECGSVAKQIIDQFDSYALIQNLTASTNKAVLDKATHIVQILEKDKMKLFAEI